MQLSDAGTYTCYEAGSTSSVSTINLVVLSKLNWAGYKARYFVEVGTVNPQVDATGAVGPSTITYAWTNLGNTISSSSTTSNGTYELIHIL